MESWYASARSPVIVLWSRHSSTRPVWSSARMFWTSWGAWTRPCGAPPCTTSSSNCWREARCPSSPSVGVRTSAQKESAALAAVPLRIRPRLDVEQLPTWHQVVLQRHLFDVDAIREGEPGLASVIIPTHADYSLTRRAVLRVSEAYETALAEWEAAGQPVG